MYLNTLRYLKPSQFYHRISYNLRKPKNLKVPKLAVRSKPREWIQPIGRKPRMPDSNTFTFLNLSKSFRETGWEGAGMDRLWRYHLHYFDDLNAECSKERLAIHRVLVDDWIRNNASFEGVGWEPYPTSLRIVNWIKWALAGNSLEPKWLESLAMQTEWLSERLEFHLLGNHLFANAKALLFSALFFEGEATHGWWKTGTELVHRQMDEQILGDGGHFERSPMYHGIVLEDLLDLLNLFKAYEHAMPGMSDLCPKLLLKISAMIDWLRAMIHPDEGIGFFNDSALEHEPEPGQIFSYASKLGFSVSESIKEESKSLEQTGYVRLAKEHAVALIDAAPIGPDYIPGHAHADTLSFELSIRGRRILVNGGTSTYQNNLQRHKERSTQSHNTVEVNGRNSSEVWGAFRVARRAKPFSRSCELGGNTASVSCSHDGYSRMCERIVHHRNWELQAGKFRILDRMEGRNAVGVARFHFHPNLQLKQRTDSIWQVEGYDHGVLFEVIDGLGMVEPSTHSPAFGRIVENQCLSVSLINGAAEVSITWD